MTDANVAQLYARLTLHEFLLEIMHANVFVGQENPTEAVENFRKDLLDRIRNRSWVETTSDEADVAKLAEACASQAEGFMDKVADRVDRMI